MKKKITENIVLQLIAFGIVHFLKRVSIVPEEVDVYVFILYLGALNISSLLTRKFRDVQLYGVNVVLFANLKALILNLGILSLFVTLFSELNPSRFVLLGSVFLYFIFEVILFFFINRKPIGKIDRKTISFSWFSVLLEFLLLSWVVLYGYLSNYSNGYSFSEEILFLSVLYLFWFLAGGLTHHFSSIDGNESFWPFIWGRIKSYVLLGALVSFVVFLLQLPDGTSKLLIYSISLFAFWAVLVSSIIYIYKKPSKTDEIEPKITGITEEISDDSARILSKKLQATSKYIFNSTNDSNGYLKEQLRDMYLKKFPNVFEFINENVELGSISPSASVILRSSDIYNVEVLPDDMVELYMNLHELNDIRRINHYMIEVNKRLKNGGIFIGKIEPNRFRKLRYLKNYPYYIGLFFYIIDFIWRRAFPKLPFVKKIYFAFTKGKKRALSMAEGLGRLYYCGFEVIGIKEIDNFLYFTARKVKEPSIDKTPSYGPFFRMKREGKGGKLIYVYKVRTMHPYSEYLQQFIYDNFSLKKGGKFDNDFRITYWGKIFRKLWIDELPMIVNWLKGELKIVGVRPLSKQYLTLYDDELVELRRNHKPGLVPPYYADMPETIEEIKESEKRYLKSYEKYGKIIDLKYFCKAFYNIILKKKRSA